MIAMGVKSIYIITGGMNMYYKQYGDTQMKVSAIGMGCMRYDDEDIKAGNLENVLK